MLIMIFFPHFGLLACSRVRVYLVSSFLYTKYFMKWDGGTTQLGCFVVVKFAVQGSSRNQGIKCRTYQSDCLHCSIGISE